jgi:hypothetical protein
MAHWLDKHHGKVRAASRLAQARAERAQREAEARAVLVAEFERKRAEWYENRDSYRDRNTKIEHLHWDEGWTLRELAEHFGIRFQRVHQILVASPRGVRNRDQAGDAMYPKQDWSCPVCQRRIRMTATEAASRVTCSRACADATRDQLSDVVIAEAAGLRAKGLTLNGVRETMGDRWTEGLRRRVLALGVKRFSRKPKAGAQ